ncbi:septation protein SepH [Nakamurella sp. GG22]
MRALRVLGLAEDGENLVCEDGASGELFTLPADERLRAATRGDLSRLGQLEIELEPQLRPREIQARIRSGSSIAEVAAAANTSIGRIERYAYPVMLERSTMAEKARGSFPMIDGNPARKTLEELVMSTLGARGQDSAVTWDAYRDADGWVVAVRWQAGRSENSAVWDIHAGPRTPTLRARDDAARDLIEPENRPLRTIPEMPGADVFHRLPDPALPIEPLTNAQGAEAPGSAAPSPTPRRSAAPTGSHHPAGTRRTLADRVEQETVERTVLDERSGMPQPTRKEAARTGTEHATARGQRKGQRPVMPGWEDVLLGGGQTPNV